MELLLPLLFLLPLLWLFSRQRKQQQSQAQMQTQLTPGVEIMTTAGMFGTVVAVDGDTMTLEVSPGVNVRLLKAALARIVPAADDSGLAGDVPLHQEGDGVVDLTKNDHERREA